MSINVRKLTPEQSELGKKSDYNFHYNPDKLFPISRIEKRKKIGIVGDILPFFGFDCWNHYEVSWLNPKGKPIVGFAKIIYGCDSPNIIESKSMKLYFNSMNNTQFSDPLALQEIIKQDLEERIGSSVYVKLTPLEEVRNELIFSAFEGISIDSLDIECTEYRVNPTLLTLETAYVEEKLHSNLLKSNCLVTNQPDWGSIQIEYKGNKINHEGLLKYLISFRNTDDFSEYCIERIFMDLMQYCKPKELIVYGGYTRRGGLDINPYRSTQKIDFLSDHLNKRLCRQ